MPVVIAKLHVIDLLRQQLALKSIFTHTNIPIIEKLRLQRESKSKQFW